MKGSTSFYALFLAAVATGCVDRSSSTASSNLPLFRSHFAGMSRVVQGTNATKLKDVWTLPASQEMRKQALDKIAGAPFQLWQKSLPSGARDNSSLIRPLLDDLMVSESFIQLGGSGVRFDSVLAIELDDSRARLWETNLWQIATGWKLATPEPLVAGASGWQARSKGVTVQVQRIRKWTIIGWSLGKLTAVQSAVELAGRSGRPATDLGSAILDLQADFPSIARWSKLAQKYKLPVSHFVITPHRDGESLRTDGGFSLAEPLRWQFEPWQIPTNRISDPLVSFSVAQPIDSLFKIIPGFSDLGLKKLPTQVCAWAHAEGSFKTYWAFPYPAATNVVRQLVPRIRSFLSHYIEDPPGNLLYSTNNSQLTWGGLPLLEPTIQGIHEDSTDYGLFGLWPHASTTKPAPPELFAQLNNRTNLLYYDWEITQQRLMSAKVLYQVVDMTHLRRLTPTNAPSLRWFDQASPKLGNAVTEITLAGPKELKLVRKSHIGLTGFELATLMRWIDSPAFPLGYEPPPSVHQKDRPKPVKK